MLLSCGTRTGVVPRWAGQLALAWALVAGGMPASAAPKAAVDAKATAQDADWLYTIQRRDTLYDLALAWLEAPRTWQDLQRLNRVADPLRLPPGGKLRMPVAWLKREAAVADVMFVKGAVTLRRGAEPEQPLSSGAQLHSSDVLRTGEQASVSVRFADGSRLLVPPKSEVQLESLLVLGRAALPAVVLRVQQGGAENQVVPNPQRTPKYEVRTPKLNLGVRGTEFRVQVDGDRQWVAVDAGRVRAAGEAADLAPGEGLVAAQGALQRARLLPAPDVAAVPRVVERLPLRLTWAPGTHSAWRAQIFARQDFNRLLLDARVKQPEVVWPRDQALPDGDYTLRLRAIDASGLEGAAADVDFSLQARPEPPFIRLPAPDAVVYGSGLELGWTLNAEAPRVRLQIARDAAFKDLVQQPPPIAGASQTVSLPPGTYHWRIASVAAERAGPFGDPQRFELREPPPAPPPATPAINGNQLDLRWPAVSGVTSYELEWASNAAFEGAQSHRTDKPELSLPKPAPGRYYLRARSRNADGIASPWGQTQLIDQPEEPLRWPWLILVPVVLHVLL